MRNLILFLCLIIFTIQPAFSVSNPTFEKAASEKPLRILSWNIYMLPRFALITGKRQRAKMIAEILHNSDYQVIVFQEAFLGDSRKIIRKGLKDVFPYEYGPANRKFSIKTNSGIWVLSKIPLKKLESIQYSECEGFDDCFARKGALLLEGEFEGHDFQILGTHLQAGGPQAIRHGQFLELRSILDAHKKNGVPQIICGDMNTAQAKEADYQDMLQCLDAEDGHLQIELERCEKGYTNDMHDKGARNLWLIDYVFYRPNAKPANRIERRMPNIRKSWSRKHRDLSDHFPVDCAIYWD